MSKLWAEQRRQGKTALAIAQAKAALASGKKLMIAVPDQSEGVKEWSERLPGFLFSLVSHWGIQPHRRRR